MKKFIFQCIIIVLSIIFCFSSNLYLCIHKFNKDLVKKDIQYLSSDKFKGRLAGTLENEEVSFYIRDKFKSYGVSPLYGNYINSFNTLYPHKTNNTPLLNVTDKKGFLIKEFTYGVDYKEDLLNFKRSDVSFKKEDSISSFNDFIQIKKDSDFFLFYVPPNNKFDFRSSFMTKAPHSMYIMINKNTFNELKNYISKDYIINCSIPFESKETSLNNIVGYIEGKNLSKPPLIISAHFDHVGTDLNGNIYNGALDNASGTAFILETANYLKSLGKPERSIIFAAFNAEEFGCLGSKSFVDNFHNKIKGGRVLNFDMIGSNNPVPIYIMGGKSDSKNTPLVNELSSICKDKNIKFDYLFDNASDHQFFREKNIEAVTLSDSDVSRIHTPEDKDTFINTSSIDRCFNVMNSEVINYAYNNNLLIFYYKQAFWISLTLLLIFSFQLAKKR